MNIKTIAQEAGVSAATVSNVINGNYNKVSEETRRKIEKIIEEADYKPNVLARSLAMQESRIISLVIPYISEEFTFNINPYYSHLIAEVERYVRLQDYYLMIRCVNNCRDILPLLSSWSVDGAIFAGVFRSEAEEILRILKIPIVFLDTHTEGLPVVNVGIHDYRGGYLSAQYLMSRGHRRIAFAAPEFGDEGVIWQRFCGFRDACLERGIEVGQENIFKADTIERSSVVTGQDIAFSPKHFTAVVVASDVSAYGIIEGLRQCSLKIPEDISVIGFDDLPISALSNPRLTTIAQDIGKKAQRAGDYLFRMIREKREITADERIPIELVERDSVRTISVDG